MASGERDLERRSGGPLRAAARAATAGGAAARLAVRFAAALVLVTACLLAGAAASWAAVETKELAFDELAPGTRITTQYAGQGVQFAEPFAFGFEPGEPGTGKVSQLANCGGPRAAETLATHSPPIFANLSCDNGEFFPAGTFAVLSSFAKRVSAYVGDTMFSSLSFRLDAYDGEGNLIGHAEASTATAAIDTPISFEAPSYEIAYFALYRTVPPVSDSITAGMDNLSLTVGEAPPEITLSANASGALAPGVTSTHQVTVLRDNGSQGNVRLRASGLPAGVSAKFEPEVLEGTQATSTLTLSAKTDAPLGEAHGAIEALPETVKAGSAARSVALNLAVVAPFAVYSGSATSVPATTTIGLPPCSTATVAVRTILEGGFPGPVDLALSTAGAGPDLAGASLERTALEPSDFDIAGVNEQRLTISRNASGPGSGSFSVLVAGTSGPFAEPPATVRVERSPPAISLLGPVAGKTPQALHPGTEVTLRGAGFCPGASVQFGNPAAGVPASFVNSAGTEMKAVVPRLATSGPVTVTSGGASATAPTALRIDSYRNINGYQFHNYDPHVTFSQLTEAFGPEQTEIKLDLCWPFGCDIKIPSPIAAIVQAIADEGLSSGACFGMSLSSQRLLEGYRQFDEFPPGNAGSVFGLAETERPSSALLNFINASHVSQLSTEFLTHMLDAEVAQGASGGVSMSRSVYEEIKSAFANGEYPLIALEEGGRGHVVVAYDLEGAPGDYYIDVYDSNDPFGWQGAEDGEENASHHEGNVLGSRVHVGSDGEWTLPSTGISGGVTGLVVTDPGTFPLRPSMIGGPGPVGFLFTSNGSGGSGSVAPASTVTQLKDAAGHTLLDASGRLNTNPATRLDAARFGPLVGGAAHTATAAGSAQAVVLSAHESALQETVTGAGSGHDTHTLLGHGFAAQIDTSAQRGVKDTLSLSPSQPRVAFSTAAAQKPLSLTLVNGLAKEAHLVQIATTSFAAHGDELQLTGGGRGLRFVHHGAATKFSITLSAIGPKGAQRFQSGPLTIGRGASASIGAIDWSRLAGLRLRIGRRVLLVRNRAHAPQLATVRALRARSKGRGVVLTISAGAHRLPAGARLAFAWLVRRGGRVVARHAALAAAGVRSASYTFTPSANGSYTLTGTVAVIARSGLTATSSRSSRRLGFRYARNRR